MPVRDYSRSIVWVLMKAVALVPKQSKKKCTKHTEATCNLLLAFQLFCYPLKYPLFAQPASTVVGAYSH